MTMNRYLKEQKLKTDDYCIRHTHLIRLYLGGNSSMVNDLRWQKMKLDVRMCDMWSTADEPSTL